MTDRLPRLPRRAPESHKGDYGRALLIGGSRGMSGAIALAGMATLRSGAGLVTLATAGECLETVAGFEPSYMTVGLPGDRDGRIGLAAKDRISELAEGTTCLACGPGLGQSSDLAKLVSWLNATFPQPLVLDADAINALAAQPEGLADAGGPRILTPHPGEFRRLIQQDTGGDDLAERAVSLATEHNIVVVLKGHKTLVTDGQQQERNTTGNPGMATGGSGDVLTGVITALVCQGLEPFDAALLGVHVHGLAGDLAAKELLSVCTFVADDLSSFQILR